MIKENLKQEYIDFISDIIANNKENVSYSEFLEQKYIEATKPISKTKKQLEKESYYKCNFVTYFDGCYGFDPYPNVPTTNRMGVCKLEYNESKNTLIVHLKRPGILIGKGGKTINDLKKHLNCNIEIIEVNLTK